MIALNQKVNSKAEIENKKIEATGELACTFKFSYKSQILRALAELAEEKEANRTRSTNNKLCPTRTRT